eukprot:765036-Pyramimonas_sp.AAC.1
MEDGNPELWSDSASKFEIWRDLEPLGLKQGLACHVHRAGDRLDIHGGRESGAAGETGGGVRGRHDNLSGGNGPSGHGGRAEDVPRHAA